MADRQIFRTRSLEKMSSPDRLDELLRVVRPHAWIPLVSVGGGIALVLVWSLFGRVPVTANGTGVLVRPKQVVAFQSAASGSLASIVVRVGETVQKGDVLANLRLPTLEKQLEQEEAKLEHFLQAVQGFRRVIGASHAQ